MAPPDRLRHLCAQLRPRQAPQPLPPLLSAAAEEGSAAPPPALARASEAELAAFIAPRLCSRADVADWTSLHPRLSFCRPDEQLGYVHRERHFLEGSGPSGGGGHGGGGQGAARAAGVSYTYDDDGARAVVAHRGEPCRISSFGDSFTSCEQVSDGETFQEVLASHIGEPVKNFGVGGHSVYQAYLRMIREDEHSPAQYVIFNIFCADHIRSIESWGAIRHNTTVEGHWFWATKPRVALSDRGDLIEVPNPCQTQEQMMRALTEPDGALEAFGDDVLLHAYARRAAGRSAAAGKEVDGAVTLGGRRDPALAELNEYSLLTTMAIIERVESWAKARGKKVLYVLSYGEQEFLDLLDGYRFDDALLRWLAERRLPVVDLLEEHRRDFGSFACSAEEYGQRYWVGHYSPLGNFFCAWAILPKLLELMGAARANDGPRAVNPLE